MGAYRVQFPHDGVVDCQVLSLEVLHRHLLSLIGGSQCQDLKILIYFISYRWPASQIYNLNFERTSKVERVLLPLVSKTETYENKQTLKDVYTR